MAASVRRKAAGEWSSVALGRARVVPRPLRLLLGALSVARLAVGGLVILFRV